MTVFLVAIAALTACSGARSLAESGTPDVVAGPSANVVASCPQTIPWFCENDACPRWPLQRGDWCDGGDHPSAPQAGLGTCSGYTVVSALDGDQGIYFFYDDNQDGWLAAVLRQESAPPCEGACTLACVAGAPQLDTAALATCVAQLHWSATCE